MPTIPLSTHLAVLRGHAVVASAPALSNDEVATLVLQQALILHGAAVFYEHLSRDEDPVLEPPVYRIGTAVILQDIQTQLTALCTAGSLFRYGTTMNAYNPNPSLRKP
jgi:hypothetical protein